MEPSIPPSSPGSPVTEFFVRRFRRIREINAKYRTPRLKTTPAVSLALLFLRLYLFLLIGILFVKFIMTIVAAV